MLNWTRHVVGIGEFHLDVIYGRSLVIFMIIYRKKWNKPPNPVYFERYWTVFDIKDPNIVLFSTTQKSGLGPIFDFSQKMTSFYMASSFSWMKLETEPYLTTFYVIFSILHIVTFNFCCFDCRFTKIKMSNTKKNDNQKHLNLSLLWQNTSKSITQKYKPNSHTKKL